MKRRFSSSSALYFWKIVQSKCQSVMLFLATATSLHLKAFAPPRRRPPQSLPPPPLAAPSPFMPFSSIHFLPRPFSFRILPPVPGSSSSSFFSSFRRRRGDLISKIIHIFPRVNPLSLALVQGGSMLVLACVCVCTVSPRFTIASLSRIRARHSHLCKGPYFRMSSSSHIFSRWAVGALVVPGRRASEFIEEE